jgi:hypothetical protein
LAAGVVVEKFTLIPGYLSSNGLTSSWKIETSVLDAKSNRPSFSPAAHTCSTLAAPADDVVTAAGEVDPLDEFDPLAAVVGSAVVDFSELLHAAMSAPLSTTTPSARKPR